MPPHDHSRRVSGSVHSRSSHLGALSLYIPVICCPWGRVWVTVELGPWMLGCPLVYSHACSGVMEIKDKVYTPSEVYKSIARLIS